MNHVIVTTTIYPVSEALSRYDEMPGWTLVVAGDLKTPANFKLKNGLYLSPSEQEKMAPELSGLIGWNSIQRRNFAFLMAHRMGADIIATIDDDNIPNERWGTEILVGKEIEAWEYQIDNEVFDPVGVSNYPHLWHRGFPLQLLSQRDYSSKVRKTIKPDIQACFWNGDPDVDAICRMEHSPECCFSDQNFPFSANKPGPFNSQNTLFNKDILPHYFMLPFIGRMDDIWASYYVQSLGYKVVYSEASVYQQRNPQDLTRNMEDEFLGYKHSLEYIRELYSGSADWRRFLPERTILAFEAYRRLFR